MRRLAFALVALPALVLAACGGGDDERQPATATPPIDETTPVVEPPAEGAPRDVQLQTDDGRLLAATLLPGGDTWILLGHQNNADRGDWQPLDTDLQAAGFTVLAWDFRGFGDSDEGDLGDIDHDWLAAITYASAQGARRIVGVGASMGGASALVAASMDDRMQGVVTISAPDQFRGLDATQGMKSVNGPLIFIVGDDDDEAEEGLQALAEAAQRFSVPFQSVLYDTGAHGNALATDAKFESPIRQLIVTLASP